MKPVHAPNTDFKYVAVFDDALPTSICDRLIEKFERNELDEQVVTDYPGIRHFKEVNISENWVDEHNIMLRYVQDAWAEYVQLWHIKMASQWPNQFGYEAFRMKRYLANGIDEFAYHTDVGNYPSARRFLSFLWYLNTVPEGGSTCFGHEPGEATLTIHAVKGRLLMFPPLWTHPHWGQKVRTTKYVVSGYLHYI